MQRQWADFWDLDLASVSSASQKWCISSEYGGISNQIKALISTEEDLLLLQWLVETNTDQ